MYGHCCRFGEELYPVGDFPIPTRCFRVDNPPWILLVFRLLLIRIPYIPLIQLLVLSSVPHRQLVQDRRTRVPIHVLSKRQRRLWYYRGSSHGAWYRESGGEVCICLIPRPSATDLLSWLLRCRSEGGF